jgi:hypothetical protein
MIKIPMHGGEAKSTYIDVRVIRASDTDKIVVDVIHITSRLPDSTVADIDV